MKRGSIVRLLFGFAFLISLMAFASAASQDQNYLKLTNGKISCLLITGGSDSDYCTDATGGGVNGSETDPFWTANQSSYFTKTIIQNYFGNGTNVNSTQFNSSLFTTGTNITIKDLTYYPYSSNPLVYWNSTFATWNETYHNSKYPVLNQTCSGTNKFSGFNNTTGSFDCTTDQSGSGGLTTDQVYVTNTSTTISFNTTLAASNLSVNSSNFWDNLNTTNTTQFSNSGGALNLIESWLRSIIVDQVNKFFDQSLNTTSNVTFANLNTTGITNLSKIAYMNSTNILFGFNNLSIGFGELFEINGSFALENATGFDVLIANSTGNYLPLTKCSAGQVLTTDSSTGVVSCITPSASVVGYVFANFTQIRSNVSSNNNTVWVALTNLTMTFTANKFYNIDCVIEASSTALTTGIRLRFNASNATFQSHRLNSWSSITQIVPNQLEANLTVLNTASQATPVYPYSYTGFVQSGQAGGNLSIFLRTEVNASAVTVTPMTHCTSLEKT